MTIVSRKPINGKNLKIEVDFDPDLLLDLTEEDNNQRKVFSAKYAALPPLSSSLADILFVIVVTRRRINVDAIAYIADADEELGYDGDELMEFSVSLTKEEEFQLLTSIICR